MYFLFTELGPIPKMNVKFMVLKFLKKLISHILPEEYVIYENADQTQIGMTTWKAYSADKPPYVHHFDTNGKPMSIKHHLWAYSWTQAMKKHNKLYNFGKYKP